jgi:hypothetical protein
MTAPLSLSGSVVVSVSKQAKEEVGRKEQRRKRKQLSW